MLPFILLATITVAASAQIRIGAKAGVNLIKLSTDKELLAAKYRSGFFIGPTLRFDIPKHSFGVDASIIYDQRTATVTEDNLEETKTNIHRKTINIPLNLRFYVFSAADVGAYIFAGPQISTHLGDDKSLKDVADNYKSEFNSSDFSINIGAGIYITKTVELSANYNIRCGKTKDIKWQTALDNTKASVKGDLRDQAWQLAAAIYF